MVDTVTLTIKCSNATTRPCTVNVADKNFINSIITIDKDNTITQAAADKLREVAERSGDYNVIESSDLNATEKLQLAKNMKFGESYDITLSKDGEYFQVKIKNSLKDPTLSDIKSDFGIRNNVFVTKNGIPHGNEQLIEENAKPGSSPDGRNTNYDATPIPAGKTINIPVSEINITGSPRGFLGRVFLP